MQQLRVAQRSVDRVAVLTETSDMGACVQKLQIWGGVHVCSAVLTNLFQPRWSR